MELLSAEVIVMSFWKHI